VKFALALVVTLPLGGCSRDNTQWLSAASAPLVSISSPAPTPTSEWGFVVDPSGACIEGATVQVVRGQSVGQSASQTTPCDAWSYGSGFALNDLVPGVEMTIRASARGWSTCEKTVVPPTTAIITLSKTGACQGYWGY
jgi:hypothetical protein